MALSQRIEFRQTQSLVMTPQLMQAIKLLQLSNLDLVAFVEEELERNPLLERAAEDGTPLEPRDGLDAAQGSLDRGQDGDRDGDRDAGGDGDDASSGEGGFGEAGFEAEGGGGPEDWPKAHHRPSGRRQSRFFGKTSLPIES